MFSVAFIISCFIKETIPERGHVETHGEGDNHMGISSKVFYRYAFYGMILFQFYSHCSVSYSFFATTYLYFDGVEGFCISSGRFLGAVLHWDSLSCRIEQANRDHTKFKRVK